MRSTIEFIEKEKNENKHRTYHELRLACGGLKRTAKSVLKLTLQGHKNNQKKSEGRKSSNLIVTKGED